MISNRGDGVFESALFAFLATLSLAVLVPVALVAGVVFLLASEDRSNASSI